jgi:hypothetical protein
MNDNSSELVTRTNSEADVQPVPPVEGDDGERKVYQLFFGKRELFGKASRRNAVRRSGSQLLPKRGQIARVRCSSPLRATPGAGKRVRSTPHSQAIFSWGPGNWN